MQEAHVLLSAAAVAGASSGFPLPCFVAVHDGLRDAFWGVGAAPGASSRHFESDSVHISNPPAGLLVVRRSVPLQWRAFFTFRCSRSHPHKRLAWRWKEEGLVVTAIVNKGELQ